MNVGTRPEPVCLVPGQSVTLRFDAPFRGEQTVLEGEGVYLAVGDKHISLDAATELAPGARRRVTVFYADGLEPASITFDLVAAPDSQLRRVNISRLPRTAASLREEVEELRRRVVACEAPSKAEAGAQMEGLLPQLLEQEELGYPLDWVRVPATPDPEFKGTVPFLRTALYPRTLGRAEAVVELRVAYEAKEAWSVEEAQLLTGDGEPLAGVRLLGPSGVRAGGNGWLRVVVPPSERVKPGTYKLRLAGGGRELVLESVPLKKAVSRDREAGDVEQPSLARGRMSCSSWRRLCRRCIIDRRRRTDSPEGGSPAGCRGAGGVYGPIPGQGREVLRRTERL